MTTVAALYIDPRGPYPRIRQCAECGDSMIDCWDALRDARQYEGPHPVVAHPPCGPWGRLRHLATYARCNNCSKGLTESEYPGPGVCGYCLIGDVVPVASDRDCAPRAVEQVRRFGGVLEHPAGSKLWVYCGLPTPDFEPAPGSRMALCGVRHISTTRNDRGDFTDTHGGYTIEVDQCEWGHVARKRTWLYLVGVPREALEAPPFPGRAPTHWCSGDMKDPARPPHIKIASAQMRRRTPPLFAEYLARLARSVRL